MNVGAFPGGLQPSLISSKWDCGNIYIVIISQCDNYIYIIKYMLKLINICIYNLYMPKCILFIFKVITRSLLSNKSREV